jgi:acetyl esterase/lipase
VARPPVPALFLAVAFVELLLVVNAWWPRRRWVWLGWLSFIAGLLTAELPLFHLAVQIGLCVYFVYAAALGAWQGVVGLLVTLVAGGLLVRSLLQARQAAEAVRAALSPFAPMPEAPLVSLWERRLLFPWPWRPKDVHIDRKVPFCDEEGCRLFADVVRPAAEGTGRAALIFVHGGGWVTGQKGLQGLPLMYRFAQAGWVCFSIDYRRSPRATFPAHIIDVKRGIAWVKANADRYGVDPTQVAISGSSAGGHLASLAALSPSDPEFQPGLEAADTSVIACLSFYGIYDFTDRHGLWPHRGLALLLRVLVMKRRLDETSRPLYEQASPLSRILPTAPPFYIVHGAADSLVPVEEARRFAADLGAVSRAPVVYVEIRGAQHAFDVIHSLRSMAVIDGALVFAEAVRARPAAIAGPS